MTLCKHRVAHTAPVSVMNNKRPLQKPQLLDGLVDSLAIWLFDHFGAWCRLLQLPPASVAYLWCPLPPSWSRCTLLLIQIHLVHQSISDSLMHQPTLQQFNQSYAILSKRITVLWNVELYCLWETLKSIHHITRGGSPCIILSCRGLFRVQSWASPNLELANRSKLNTITGKRLNLQQKNLCLLNPDWELCQDWLTDPIRWEPSVLISTARCS